MSLSIELCYFVIRLRIKLNLKTFRPYIHLGTGFLWFKLVEI
jgi:hypothetical protein